MSELLSEQLKQLTKRNHQQLEKLLIPHLRSVSTNKEYIQLLQIFYGFFGALEEKIKYYVGKEQLPDFTERRKTESIANDIQIMGGTIPEKAKGTDLPQIKNHLQALGALYVIEGSTLGGKIISQMMVKQLNLPDNKGVSFFSGYGADTERMWNSFKKILDNQYKNSAEADLIVKTANDTFLQFKLWIEKMSGEMNFLSS
ncbi:MAG: biliverdin-producing heme oxygenase [Ginsengibacter sp.]